MLEHEDGQQRFIEDIWQRQQGEGGGGISRNLEDGPILERAGVNFSHVYGDQLPPSATKNRPFLAGRPFEALGISMVIHPRNPFAPTMHANLRFFHAMQTNRDSNADIWWFGGGLDLTPYYGFVEDCIHWHHQCYLACQPYDDSLYDQFKQNCDDYFYLPHRNEQRGIGGLFFDDLNEWDFKKCFSLVQNIGDIFIPAYQPILTKRKNEPYQKKHRKFQSYRRGRYVEFNLLYDRGTLFGLHTKGRTESILMSLPPEVTWRYNWQPKKNSEEERLYKEFLIPKNWHSLFT